MWHHLMNLSYIVRDQGSTIAFQLGKALISRSCRIYNHFLWIHPVLFFPWFLAFLASLEAVSLAS